MSVTTAHVEKESISSSLKMPVYFFSQVASPHLLEVAMILDFGLIIPLLYCFMTIMLFNFAIFEVYTDGIHASYTFVL